MSVVAVPTSAAAKRRIPWLLALYISLGIVAVLWLVSVMLARRGGTAPIGDFYSIVPMDMDITISKDGELAAVNNVDIVCPVEGQSVVLDIAKEGAFVHKGDVIVRIDSSDIQQKIENAQLDLQAAQSNFTAAQEAKAIQESTNAASLEASQVDLTVARLEVLQYTEGDYPASLEKAKIAVDMAQTTLKNKEDDLAQTRKLFGKGFVTASEVKTTELAVLQSKNDLAEKQSELNVLEKYQHEKDLATKKSALAQAEKKLTRVQRENLSNLAQRVATLQAYEQMLSLRKQQLEHLQEQFAACTIKAPSDGMIVYGSSGAYGRRETPIQPGATVRQQELLIRLPDTTSMKVVAKINETQVPRLRVDPNNPMRATIKVPGQPVPFTGWLSNISVLADSSQRFWNPDSKEYPVDITFDQTPSGLKPGMSGEARIFVDRLKNVLAVPLSSIYAAGRDSYVFVREQEKVTPVKVAIGDVSETHAQVMDGVSMAQQVLILQAGQGRDLLDKAGIKVRDQDHSSDALFKKLGKPVPVATPGSPPVEKEKASGDHKSGKGKGHKDRELPTTIPATSPVASR